MCTVIGSGPRVGKRAASVRSNRRERFLVLIVHVAGDGSAPEAMAFGGRVGRR